MVQRQSGGRAHKLRGIVDRLLDSSRGYVQTAKGLTLNCPSGKAPTPRTLPRMAPCCRSADRLVVPL